VGRWSPYSPAAQADQSPCRSRRAVGVSPGRGIVVCNEPDKPDIGVRTSGKDAHRRSAQTSSRPRLINAELDRFWEGQSLLIQRPLSVPTRRGGLSPTWVPVCALIRGPARTSSSSIWMLVQDQHHCLRVSKTSTYRMSAASRMLPKQPLKKFHSHRTCTSREHCQRRARWRGQGGHHRKARGVGALGVWQMQEWAR